MCFCWSPLQLFCHFRPKWIVDIFTISCPQRYFLLFARKLPKIDLRAGPCPTTANDRLPFIGLGICHPMVMSYAIPPQLIQISKRTKKILEKVPSKKIFWSSQVFVFSHRIYPNNSINFSVFVDRGVFEFARLLLLGGNFRFRSAKVTHDTSFEI